MTVRKRESIGLDEGDIPEQQQAGDQIHSGPSDEEEQPPTDEEVNGLDGEDITVQREEQQQGGDQTHSGPFDEEQPSRDEDANGIEEQGIPAQHEEQQQGGDQTHSGPFDEEQPPRDEDVNGLEEQEDAERREQQFHLPHEEECKQHPANTKHLTDEERARLIQDAWKFLDEAHPPCETEYNEDEEKTLSRGLQHEEVREGCQDGIDLSEIEEEESKEELIFTEQRTDHEHYWDCLFTSLKVNDDEAKDDDDIQNNNEVGATEHRHHCNRQSKTSGTDHEAEMDEGEQLPDDTSERTIEDVVDEMSDGVYSYDVQSESDKYAVYSEFDIMEALVKAGLLNETEKEPGIPKFPVDDSILEYGDDDPRSASSNRDSEEWRRLQSSGDRVVTEGGDTNSTREYSSNSSERVPSQYDNVREEKSDDDTEPVWSGQRPRPTGFKQCSFDSGLDDAEGEDVDGGSDWKESYDNIHNVEESQGKAEWGAYKRMEGDKRYIDECYRMSRLSIMLDNFQDLTWHENAAFKLATAAAPAPIAVDEDTRTYGDGYDTNDTVDRLLAADDQGRQRLDSQSSESCSSGSYCIQPHNRLMECRSMGSLDHLCSPRETQSVCELDVTNKSRNRNDVLKTMSCSNVDMVVPPPKPRRTWYYQSSWDVRRSLVRSFGSNYDGIDNPIYDEPPPMSMPDLYATVSKPVKEDRRGNEPTYAKVVKKKHLSPASSEASSNTVHKSGTASSNDSGVVLLANKTKYKSRSYSHLYEDIANLNIKSSEKSDTLSRYLEEDSSEATYEVCTLWVNGKYNDALDTFNHLTQRLASLYSIVPEARKEESRRSALLYDDLEGLEDDYPAWANILNVLASDEEKWTLRLSVKVLPIVDRLFQVKDKNVLNAVIELVKVLIKRYGKDITKNRHPSLFKTRFREDCRECFMWLNKLKLRTEFLLMKQTEAQTPDWDCLLHSSLLDSFSDSLLPFNKSMKSR